MAPVFGTHTLSRSLSPALPHSLTHALRSAAVVADRGKGDPARVNGPTRVRVPSANLIRMTLMMAVFCCFIVYKLLHLLRQALRMVSLAGN